MKLLERFYRPDIMQDSRAERSFVDRAFVVESVEFLATRIWLTRTGVSEALKDGAIDSY